MKKVITCLLMGAALLAPCDMDAATIRLRSRTLTFSEDTPEGKVAFIFSKCMANNLYTFQTISIDNTVLNQTGSDNIGPFLAGGAWMGGNHPHSNMPSAKTISTKFYLDGEEISGTVTKDGNVLTVEVVNELYYSDGEKFADELMTYIVSGNSIEVKAHHDYAYKRKLNVDRYYGMQSMFVSEKELLLPGTPNEKWIELPNKANNAIDVKKKDAPNFTTFVEKGANGYQASYLLREGLGNREWVKDNDLAFTCQSYSAPGDYKSYHKIIGAYNVEAGMSSDWHGIYSWFKAPITDTFRSGEGEKEFSYRAYIDGKETKMTIKADGSMETEDVSGVEDVVVSDNAPLATVSNGTVTVLAADGKCFDVAGKLVHSGAGSFSCNSGVYIVSDSRGNSVKLLVK